MRNRRWFLPAFISTIFAMDALDGAMLGTMLPAIARELNTDPVQAKLAFSAYYFSLATLAPTSRWIANQAGIRIVFSVAIAVFVCGSLLCAIAFSMPGLILARVIQGIGGALLFPLGWSILVSSVPKNRIVSVTSFLTVPSAIAMIVGPLIAGHVTTFSDWRLLFLINLPIGLLALPLVFILIPVRTRGDRIPFDARGSVLVCGGIAFLCVGMASLGVGFMPQWLTYMLVVLGSAFIAQYCRYSGKVAHPLLNLAIFRYRTFRFALFSSFVTRACTAGALPFVLPMMFQVGFALTPAESGSITFVGAVAILVAKASISPALRYIGFRHFLAATGALSGLSVFVLALTNTGTSSSLFILIIFTGSIFRVLQILAWEALLFEEIPAEELGGASSLLSVSKQLSAVAGVAFAAMAVQIIPHFVSNTGAIGEYFRLSMIPISLPLFAIGLMSLFLSRGDGTKISGHRAKSSLHHSSQAE